MRGTLLDRWRKTTHRAPDAPAVIDAAAGRVWTRAELSEGASVWRKNWACAAALSGRRVLVAEPNGPRWFHVFLGLLEAGAVPLLADATEPVEGLREAAGALGADRLWAGGELQALSGVRARPAKGFCLGKLTSGTTGRPRARLFTDAQMIADGRQICASMGIGPNDLDLAVIPLGHSYGLGNLVVPLLVQGTAMVCSGSPFPQVLATDCARWRPTVFPAVPTLLRALVRAEIDAAAFASLRLVISAGAALPPEIAAAFAEKFGRRVCGFYGSSETGGISFDQSGEATLAGRSVGTPLKGVRLHFRRRRRFAVESPAVMGHGVFSPPDRGELGESGELVLLGRTGRTVKIAGRRVDLGEIENAMVSVPGVRGAYADAHPARADALAAVAAADLSAAELRAHLLGRMAAWRIPERIVVVAELPVTERGKADKRRLRDLLAAPREEPKISGQTRAARR